MKKFENVEVLSYNIYIKVENLIWCLSILEIISDCLSEEAGSTPAGIAIAFRWMLYKNIGSN